MENKTNNKPVKKFRSGQVTATIWKNEIIVEKVVKEVYSVNIEKSYKNKEDEWAKTTNLNSSDIHKALLVLNEANKFLNVKTEE